jgi:methylmalonyl-CoA/ethylmalonyl-CoA epimerase
MTPNAPLHHVGIVQPSEEEAMAMMQVMGLREDYRGYVEQWSALCIFTYAEQGSPIEFVVPDAGPLLKFNKGAGGLHHLAFVTEDLDALALELAKDGMRFLEPRHVKGAGPFMCNFLSPIYTRGLTVEYVQLLS